MHLSQKFLDFSAESLVSNPYLIANAVRLALSTQQATDLGNFNTDWGNVLSAYTNPATHTPDSVLAIQNEYHDYHPYLEGIKKQLKNNRTITLLPLDITSIQIHVDALRRGHIPRPLFAPNNLIIGNRHLVTDIFTNNPNPPHENEEKLPVDVSQIGRKLAVVPAGSPAPALAQYHNLENIGTTNYSLVFNPEQGGAVAYLITWYINARGEAGPQSEPLAIQILGMPATV